MDYNFGSLKIHSSPISDQEVALEASVRDLDGKEVLRKDFTKKDLAYSDQTLDNSKLCIA
eukprot:CAMPEP_0170456312 /NCGR_PEP_ID=MMETSP0123-20130129/3992_1 /TAXON_ID=182087 /ORGANISM="Favella ehrenbergii, Strain Fehren 1" /LENGTH=59 /DNA_ID=CAMNT_0010719755 /DNA_START=898 /DNA_END=1077 /DNA_ORIENTATION=-